MNATEREQLVSQIETMIKLDERGVLNPPVPCGALHLLRGALEALTQDEQERDRTIGGALWPPSDYDGPGVFDGPTGAE